MDVIGKIDPLIVGIVQNPDGIAEGNALLSELEMTQASTNWFMSGLSYVGFCMLWLAAFLTALGRTARSRREAASGGLVGAVAFSVACIIVGLGLLANITGVAGTEIPMLSGERRGPAARLRDLRNDPRRHLHDGGAVAVDRLVALLRR